MARKKKDVPKRIRVVIRGVDQYLFAKTEFCEPATINLFARRLRNLNHRLSGEDRMDYGTVRTFFYENGLRNLEYINNAYLVEYRLNPNGRYQIVHGGTAGVFPAIQPVKKSYRMKETDYLCCCFLPTEWLGKRVTRRIIRKFVV